MLAVANIGTTRAEFAGIAAGFELFGISRYASVPAVATDTAAQITLAHCLPRTTVELDGPSLAPR